MNATSAEQASAPVTEDALHGVLLAGERPPRPGPVSTSLAQPDSENAKNVQMSRRMA